MKRILIVIVLLFSILSLSGCWEGIDEDSIVELKVINNTPIQIVTGFHCKSGRSAEKGGSYYDELYSVGMYTRIGDNCNWIEVVKGETFNDVFNTRGTDTLSLLISSSKYNLKMWKETRLPEYLLKTYTFTPEKMAGVGKEYTIEFVPDDDIYVKVVNNPYTRLAVGLMVNGYNRNGNTVSGISSSFFSVIGYAFRHPIVYCPTGFRCNSFNEFFSKTEVEELNIILAATEDDMIKWKQTGNDSLLIRQYNYHKNELTGKKEIVIDLNE